MPTNTQQIAAILAGTVPPDRFCVNNGQDVVNLVQDYCTVVFQVLQAISGDSSSIAQLALQTANIALQTANAAAAAVPQRRTSGSDPQPVPSGDSTFPLTWATAMPDTNYEVRIIFFGPDTNSGSFCFLVRDNTRTVNGCSVRLENMPANMSIVWVVESLPS